MANEKIKVVQVGANHDHASGAMGTLKKLSDLFEVVGIVFPEGTENALHPAYEGVRALTEEQALNCG
ncbi:MAG: hypothetical protein IJV00_01230, partial [Clostridia bacterium]|nr:hypothetical protein [Clostridia bacterium]